MTRTQTAACSLIFTILVGAGAVYGVRYIRDAQARQEKLLAEAFSCGYTYGTGDSVRLYSPALGNLPGIRPPKRCADIEQLATDHGVVRIIKRESKP